MRLEKVLLQLLFAAAIRCAADALAPAARDHAFMGLALEEARAAAAAGEVPVGAVVVDDATETVVARGRNAVEATHDASAHAELVGLRRAARVGAERGEAAELGEARARRRIRRRAAAARENWRLANCTLYSTLEPCPLCLSAAYAFRVRRVVYGAPDHRLGAIESWLRLPEADHPFHSLEIEGGVRAGEAADAMRDFFRSRREDPPRRGRRMPPD